MGRTAYPTGPRPYGLPDKHVPLFVVARRADRAFGCPHGAALYLPPGTRLHTL